MTPLKRSNPEVEGMSSSAVLDFIQALEQHTFPLDAVQGFMEHLLPAMRPNALPADAQAYGALCDKLAALSLPLPEGQPSSPAAAVAIRGRMDGVPMMM